MFGVTVRAWSCIFWLSFLYEINNYGATIIQPLFVITQYQYFGYSCRHIDRLLFYWSNNNINIDKIHDKINNREPLLS